MMSCLRSLSMGFIRFFELAQKKKYLGKGSILIWFLHQLSLITPKTSTLHPPPALTTGLASSRIPPMSRLVVFCWLLCVLASFGSRFRPR